MVEKPVVFIVFSGIPAILSESLGQLWVFQAGLKQLPGGQDLELSYCQA